LTGSRRARGTIVELQGWVAASACAVVALLLVALSLGLSNFAASIAIGVSGVDRQLRVGIALACGRFEAGMPIVGLLAGREVSHTLGSRAHLIGGGLLIANGVYAVVQSIWTSEEVPSAIGPRGGRLVVMAASLSVRQPAGRGSRWAPTTSRSCSPSA
jgi:manganese efflux pump family protein